MIFRIAPEPERPFRGCTNTFHFRETIMARKIIAVVAVVTGLALAGCNTVEGAGKDVSSAGKAVSGAASEAK